MRTSAAIALPAALLLLLAGCAGGGTPDGGTDGDPDGSSTASPGGDAIAAGDECPFGVWSLDVPDLAIQLETSLEQTTGRENAVTMDGGQRLEWGADGAVEFSTDLTVTVTTTLDEGLDMVMTQVHSGGSSGDLEYADGVATATDWDTSGYTVSTSVLVGGVDTPGMEAPLGGAFDASTPMQITCDGDTMLTHTPPSPMTQRWLRQD